jgi:hypothetical protein
VRRIELQQEALAGSAVAILTVLAVGTAFVAIAASRSSRGCRDAATERDAARARGGATRRQLAASRSSRR